MYQRIFVPIDGSAPANAGLEEAIRLARVSGGTLRVAYVLDELDFTTGFETPSTYFTDAEAILRKSHVPVLTVKAPAVNAISPAADTAEVAASMKDAVPL